MIDNKCILVEDPCFYTLPSVLFIIGNKYILLKKGLIRPVEAQLVPLKEILKYGNNDRAFQHLLDVYCIIKTKGTIPSQSSRKNDGCVCRSVKPHVCKNSLSRIFQFVKINELYNIYIYSPE